MAVGSRDLAPVQESVKRPGAPGWQQLESVLAALGIVADGGDEWDARMTTQFQDEVHFRAVRYAITAIDGDGLFEPNDHGLHPRALSSACWRGYICSYRVDGGALHLTHLEIGLPSGEDPAAARIFGCAPAPRPANAWHPDATHFELAAAVDFTGRLLLGAGHVRGAYLNMGFHPAWLYKDVHELAFDHGQLLTSTDHSTTVAELRGTLDDQATRPHADESTSSWVERTFSRAFTYSLPPLPTPGGSPPDQATPSLPAAIQTPDTVIQADI